MSAILHLCQLLKNQFDLESGIELFEEEPKKISVFFNLCF